MNDQNKPQKTPFEELLALELELLDRLQTIQEQQTGVLTKLRKLIEQTGTMGSVEAKLNAKIGEIQKIREVLQNDPVSAQQLIEQVDINSIKNEFVPKKPAVKPEIKEAKIDNTATPAETKPTPAATTSIPSKENSTQPQPIPPATPTAPPLNTSSQPTTPTQRIIQKLRSHQPVELQTLLTPDASVALSPDGNGITVTKGDQQHHFSDADLIQAGCTAEDVLALQK